MGKAGFKILGHKDCPIAPVYLGDAKLATDFANEMMDQGVYVIGFSFPVVPKDKARIRVQLSGAHTREHIDRAVDGFIKVGRAKKVIP
jgi:glycine C-acetyltransferase